MNSINSLQIDSSDDALDCDSIDESPSANKPKLQCLSDNPLISNKGRLRQDDLCALVQLGSELRRSDARDAEVVSVSASLDSVCVVAVGLNKKRGSHVCNRDNKVCVDCATKANVWQKNTHRMISRMSSTEILLMMMKH